jgi:hypothetical protein
MEKNNKVRDLSSQPPQEDSNTVDQTNDTPLPLVLLVIGALLLLAGGGYLVSMKLAEDSRLQDCMMQGRHNCTTTVDPAASP